MGRKDIKEIEKIEKLTELIVQSVKPQKIYLFGSFARGEQKMDSDYDFYLVVDDDVENMHSVAARAHYAIHKDQNRAVDIVVERSSKFNQMKNIGCALENLVANEGVLLYE